jgi:hypothetical protein
MKLDAKAMMVLSVVVITSGLLLISESELSRPDYASAAVPAPGPSQKKVIVKNLHMV